MDDSEVLAWISKQAAQARWVFSVCTGALLLGAAGLLIGRRATTHWASWDLLPYIGATSVDERVVVDGNMIFAAGVAYAPEPPFSSGRPDTAPPAVLRDAEQAVAAITARRQETARRISQRLAIGDPIGRPERQPGNPRR